MTNASKILTFRENLLPLLHFLVDREIWVFILCSSWYLAITESSYADNLSRRIGRKGLQDLQMIWLKRYPIYPELNVFLIGFKYVGKEPYLHFLPLKTLKQLNRVKLFEKQLIWEFEILVELSFSSFTPNHRETPAPRFVPMNLESVDKIPKFDHSNQSDYTLCVCVCCLFCCVR